MSYLKVFFQLAVQIWLIEERRWRQIGKKHLRQIWIECILFVEGCKCFGAWPKRDY